MKVSLKWLKTMVDVPVEAKDLANKLDLTGTAVESIESTGQRLDGVVVGQIIKRGKHPNADTLWVTSVDVGQHNVDENGDAALVQIVCGAQNFDAGDKVPVALVGAVLPNGLEIKKAKLRGIESRGMNCSGRELGLSDDAAGLLILPADAPVGTAFADYLQMGDTVLDLEITPNRPDCMSMLGVAREIGAVYNIDYCVGREVPKSPIGEPVENLVRVTIDDEVRCPRYTARVIKGVKVGPSPEWLVERVTAAGARSINNIVDVSNYIMYELGQPTVACTSWCALPTMASSSPRWMALSAPLRATSPPSSTAMAARLAPRRVSTPRLGPAITRPMPPRAVAPPSRWLA